MHTLDAEQYTSTQQFSKEIASIFLTEWIPIAHTSEFLEKPFALERTLYNHSLIILATKQGFQAFRNICPHRAGPLLWEGECTPLKALRCKYHGWRFDLQGQQTHSPDFGEEQRNRLQSVHIQVYNGLIFVCFASSPPPFQWPQLLDTHAPDLSSFSLYKTATHLLHCNWKTYVENYLEGYHIPYIHPSLRASIQQSQYKIHIHDTLITHEVPAKEDSPIAGFWAYMWPNTAINVYGTGMSIERILPIDVNHTHIQYLYLFVQDTPIEEKEAAIAMSREVTEEDILICNAVAKNLRSGQYQKGPLSPKHEHGLLHVHNLIRKALHS